MIDHTPTTADLLAGLRAAVDWISANADTLPGGWKLEHSEDETTLAWHGSDNNAVRERLESTFGRGEDRGLIRRFAWTGWPAEGDRPELVVFSTTPRPQEKS